MDIQKSVAELVAVHAAMKAILETWPAEVTKQVLSRVEATVESIQEVHHRLGTIESYQRQAGEAAFNFIHAMEHIASFASPEMFTALIDSLKIKDGAESLIP